MGEPGAARGHGPGSAMSEPWLARPDWAGGRIRDTRFQQLGCFLWFAVLWTLGTGGLAVALLGNGGGLFVLVFPGVGLLLLAGALYGRAHQQKFGTPIFELPSVPVLPGQTMAGLVRTTAAIDPAGGFTLRLRCARRVETGSGKNRRTSTTTLWESEQVMPGASRRADGIAIPVAFEIPADVPESDLRRPRDQIRWSLEVKASLPGVDFSAHFDLPVYHPGGHDPRPSP